MLKGKNKEAGCILHNVFFRRKLPSVTLKLSDTMVIIKRYGLNLRNCNLEWSGETNGSSFIKFP